MSKLARTIPVAILVATALMAAPSGAGAVTQIGVTFPGTYTCVGPSTYFMQSSLPASPSYVLPADGVITSWSLFAGGGASGQVKLGVLRNAGAPSRFATIGASVARTLTASSTNTFPTQIPAQADDRIAALILSGSNYGCASFGFDPADIGQRDAALVHDAGDTFTYTDPSNGTRINLAATVEPDCDNDGLGDETQDPNISSCAPGTTPPPTGTPPPGSPPGTPPVTCKGLVATIVGSNGSDVRTGSLGQDVIAGLGGNDTLSGLAGNDVICGGAGKDLLKGGKGKDTLLGQKGKDTLKGGGGKDVCKGGKGNDTASKCEVEKSI